MTEMDESRTSDLAAVISLNDQVSRWFLEDALPLWDRHGVDRRSGGYFEDLSFHRGSIEGAGAVRRGRVVARQIYVFDVGHRWGWSSSLSSPVEHGCEYLFSHLHAGDGMFHTAIDGRHAQRRARDVQSLRACLLSVCARPDCIRASAIDIRSEPRLCAVCNGCAAISEKARGDSMNLCLRRCH